MSKYIPQSDIVVLGAGMVGASLVHLLKPALARGMSLTLIDRQALNWDGDIASRPPSFDGRAGVVLRNTADSQSAGCVGSDGWARLCY